jgi:hypothetical protein
MAAQLQLLAVFIGDLDQRRAWRGALETIPGVQSVLELDNGWLVAESALGTAQSAYFGTQNRVRFLLGEELFQPTTTGVEALRTCLANSPALIDQFPGDFSCAFFEPQGHVHIARSCLGIPALYVATAHDFVAVSTRLDWVGLVVPEPPRIDWLPVALYAMGWACFPDSRSPLVGVHYLKRGSAARAMPDSPVHCTQYWQPGPAQMPTPSAERRDHLVATIRESLRSELGRHLSRAGDNAVFFSGGLDSAAVAATARSLGFSQLALSRLPPGDSPESSRERRYLTAASSWFSRHVIQEFSREEALEAAVQGAASYYPVSQYWHMLEALEQPPATVTGGWLADESLGILRIADWVAAARTRDLAQLFSNVTDPAHVLRRWHQWRSAPPAAYLPVRLRRLFAELVGGDYLTWRQRVVADPTRVPNQRLRLSIDTVDFAGIYSEVCASRGTALILPFANRALVEAACHAHPADLFHRGIQKVPLREAMLGVLPDPFRTRTDSGNFSEPNQKRRRNGPESVTLILAQAVPQLDNSTFRGQSRLSWHDKADLGWIHRISMRHQALHNDRRNLRNRH